MSKRKIIIIISSVILIILGIIIGVTRALANDFIITCDKTQLLPNQETTCRISGVAAQSISGLEFYIHTDNDLDYTITGHNEEWENFNNEYGEIVMYTMNDFVNTFDILTFTVRSGSKTGNFKIYLTNGKMIDNESYSAKTIENKEVVINVSSNVSSNSANSSNSKPSSNSSKSSSVNSSSSKSSNIAPSSSIKTINSTSQKNNNNIDGNPDTGNGVIIIVIMGLAAIGYSVWYFKKIKAN